MANQEQLDLLRQDINAWNAWRSQHLNDEIDLSEADLSKIELSVRLTKKKLINGFIFENFKPRFGKTEVSEVTFSGANLNRAHLRGANLNETLLIGAQLVEADLSGANLSGANLIDADLSGANLSGANLSKAHISNQDISMALIGRGASPNREDLRTANLSGANLSEANLSGAHLTGINLSGANLSGDFPYWIDLGGAYLYGANLSGANLSGAMLTRAMLRRANLSKADLSRTHLIEANLIDADLSGAHLNQAHLIGADLSGANLIETDLSGTTFQTTVIAENDLSTTKGLAEINHQGPSHISLQSVKLPQDGSASHFLRGAGVPDEWIELYQSMVMKPIQYYSCFISYSSSDDMLARRLHADLQDHGVRCWFAPHDLRPGQLMRKGIDEAIHLQDKLLLILSEHAVESGWVSYEVETALMREIAQKREILFPIRIDDAIFQSSTSWARDLRGKRHIGDFRQWADPEHYQNVFQRLLRDLKQQA